MMDLLLKIKENNITKDDINTEKVDFDGLSIRVSYNQEDKKWYARLACVAIPFDGFPDIISCEDDPIEAMEQLRVLWNVIDKTQKRNTAWKRFKNAQKAYTERDNCEFFTYNSECF